MKNLLQDQETKTQFIWIFLIRLIGLVMFIAPIYLPVVAYFNLSIPNISPTFNEVCFSFVGLFMSAGGKHIGILINNIGLAISRIFKKLS